MSCYVSHIFVGEKKSSSNSYMDDLIDMSIEPDFAPALSSLQLGHSKTLSDTSTASQLPFQIGSSTNSAKPSISFTHSLTAQPISDSISYTTPVPATDGNSSDLGLDLLDFPNPSQDPPTLTHNIGASQSSVTFPLHLSSNQPVISGTEGVLTECDPLGPVGKLQLEATSVSTTINTNTSRDVAYAHSSHSEVLPLTDDVDFLKTYEHQQSGESEPGSLFHAQPSSSMHRMPSQPLTTSEPESLTSAQAPSLNQFSSEFSLPSNSSMHAPTKSYFTPPTAPRELEHPTDVLTTNTISASISNGDRIEGINQSEHKSNHLPSSNNLLLATDMPPNPYNSQESVNGSTTVHPQPPSDLSSGLSNNSLVVQGQDTHIASQSRSEQEFSAASSLYSMTTEPNPTTTIQDTSLLDSPAQDELVLNNQITVTHSEQNSEVILPDKQSDTGRNVNSTLMYNFRDEPIQPDISEHKTSFQNNQQIESVHNSADTAMLKPHVSLGQEVNSSATASVDKQDFRTFNDNLYNSGQEDGFANSNIVASDNNLLLAEKRFLPTDNEIEAETPPSQLDSNIDEEFNSLLAANGYPVSDPSARPSNGNSDFVPQLNDNASFGATATNPVVTPPMGFGSLQKDHNISGSVDSFTRLQYIDPQQGLDSFTALHNMTVNQAHRNSLLEQNGILPTTEVEDDMGWDIGTTPLTVPHVTAEDVFADIGLDEPSSGTDMAPNNELAPGELPSGAAVTPGFTENRPIYYPIHDDEPYDGECLPLGV